MFTGLIERVGTLARLESRGTGARLIVAAGDWDSPVIPGESVAVQGACLTVTETGSGHVSFDVLNETLQRTALGEKRPGGRLNLERALQAGGRFGGHFVTGHVDGTGRVAGLDRVGADWLLEVACARELAHGIVEKGSITVDGVSLTVTRAMEEGFEVQIIPFTWQHTSLPDLKVGGRVNLETDLIGKYVLKAVSAGGAPKTGGPDVEPALLDLLADA